jgi:rhodanese-related sulfurtransferase
MSVTSIRPDQLAELCRGRAIDLIDVRTPAEFQELHATPARNVPLDLLDPAAVMQGRPGCNGEPLYIICRSGGRGRKACEAFLAAGFANVVNVEGGTLAWEACGLPVVRGRKTISLERQVRLAAGTLVFLGSVLALTVSPWFALLSAACGLGLVHAGATDSCLMGMMLAPMPWNRRA